MYQDKNISVKIPKVQLEYFELTEKFAAVDGCAVQVRKPGQVQSEQTNTHFQHPLRASRDQSEVNGYLREAQCGHAARSQSWSSAFLLMGEGRAAVLSPASRSWVVEHRNWILVMLLLTECEIMCDC